MVWLVPILSGMAVSMAKMLFTEEVMKRVFIDMGWHLAKKSSNDLDDQMMNTVSKALKYKYKAELDKK